jgi:hypothetical protein
MPYRRFSMSILPAAIVFLAGCDGTTVSTEPGEFRIEAARTGGSDLSGAQLALAREVMGASARFHSITQAEAAGYVVNPNEPCIAAPGVGGMGYHVPNFGLVNNGFDPLNPDVLLYATGPSGKKRLVAVEYIVLNTGQTAPTFAGQAFDVGGTPNPAPHWSLHVWLWQNNPAGTFARFNPTVTCP